MFPLSKDVRQKYLDVLAKSYPNVKSWCSSDKLIGHLTTRDSISLPTEVAPGAHTIKKFNCCCGVIEMGSWPETMDDLQKAAFQIYVDNVVSGRGGSLTAGAIVTTTNHYQRSIEAHLRDNGFTGVEFYNASSGGRMTMWTLILHPKEGVEYVDAKADNRRT